jgi:alpha-beta hydrolase superfamily lysophospholipase
LADVSCTIETFTAGDGYAWTYRHYPAAGQPRGHVVAIHGIQSHGGWYGHSCASLAAAGFTVDFLDRRGSGLNGVQRGDAPGFRRLLDDLAEFLRAARQSASLPVILVAISWGGKLGVALQRRHPGLVDGLALLCPGFFPQVRPTLGARLGIVWARLVAPRRKFAIPLNEPDLFTANPRWQEFIRTDPLALREATARLLIESVRLDGYLRVVPAHVRAPVLLMLAGRDRIIRNERTRRFVDSFATKDRHVVEYPEAHHTLEFEPDPEPFLRDLRAWLDRVCALAAAHV